AEVMGIAPSLETPGATDLFSFDGLAAAWQSTWNTEHDVQPELVPASDVDGVPASAAPPSRRILTRTRTRYRADDLSDLLPLGGLDPLALSGDTYRLAFTPSLIARVFGTGPDGLIDDATLTEGGYVFVDGAWWAPTGTVFYSAGDADSSAAELAEARAHFYQPRRAVD